MSMTRALALTAAAALLAVATPAHAEPLRPTAPTRTVVSPCPTTATACTIHTVGRFRLMTWTDSAGVRRTVRLARRA